MRWPRSRPLEDGAPALAKIVDAPENPAPSPIGQFSGDGVDAEDALDLVEQLQRLAAGWSSLLMKVKIGRPLPPADLEQFQRLLLDATGGIEHHHRPVGGRERAIRVLGEILVARRVEEIEAATA